MTARYLGKYRDKLRNSANDDFYKDMLADVKEVYEKNRERVFEPLSYSLWKIFS